MRCSIAKSSASPSYGPLPIVFSVRPTVDVANENTISSWKNTTEVTLDRVLDVNGSHDRNHRSPRPMTILHYGGVGFSCVGLPDAERRLSGDDTSEGIAAYNTLQKGPSVLSALADELFDLTSETGVLFEELFQSGPVVFEVVDEAGVLGGLAHELPADLPLLPFELLFPLLGERLGAPDARRLFTRRLAFAPRARDGADGIGLVFFDVETVDLGERAVGLVVEDGDVAGGDTRPADPAVMVLDMGLIHALRSEVTRRGLAEVGRCDRLRDARPLGRVLEDVEEGSAGDVVDTLGEVKATPQRRGGVIGRGMATQPFVDVGDARDERDSPLTFLPVDGDGEAVLVIGDVADTEGFEFAGSRASVPRERDKRLVSLVVARLNHREDVVIPVEHLRGIGRGVVVRARPGGDPLATVGGFGAVLADSVAREDFEGDSIVLVGLLVVVGGVDPRDDALGRVALGERLGEPFGVLGDDRAVTEEFQMSIIPTLRFAEVQRVREVDEGVGIGVSDLALAVVDLGAQGRDLLVGVGHDEYAVEGVALQGSEPQVVSQGWDGNLTFKAKYDARADSGGAAA